MIPAAAATGRYQGLPEASVRFRWPGEGPDGECDNFFLGIWHPRRMVRLRWSGVPSVAVVSRRGPNWFLVSASSPRHATPVGLVHAAPEDSGAVAFRGYVLPGIHSYSPSSNILSYWRKDPFAEHNGVFSAAIIGRGGDTLTLITDVFGMGPLYYRPIGDAVIFSTNPRYLAMDDDAPDLLAWRYLIQTSWIGADRSLSRLVRRVPAGSALCLSPDGDKLVPWFNPDRLSRGTRPVGPKGVAEVEEAFQRSVDRCLQLQTGSVVLPLSSGFDSRRILAGLLHRKVDFQAFTCRLFQRDYRDLDARFADQIARDFGFQHTVVESDSLEQYVLEDRARRILVDGETTEHTWAVRLMKSLPPAPAIFLAGIGGDILGDPVGWAVHTGLAVEQRSQEQELQEVADLSITSVLDPTLRRGQWPDTSELREDLKKYLRGFLPRENIGEVAFLLLRQRRAIAVWSQQLLPPGLVAVCPYLDLDYLRLLLDFTSAGKHESSLQRACLKTFWPQFYKYSGTRDIPADLPPGSPTLVNERIAGCHASMRDEIKKGDGMAMLGELLSPRGRWVLEVARRSQAMTVRASWYLTPLLQLVSRQVRVRPCWESGAA